MVSTRSSSRAESVGPEASSPPSSKRSNNKSIATTAISWQHTPTFWTLFWMTISLPLVIWDTVYVLGRPHTMEGGWLHWPFWAPYKLYGEVDHVYGWKSFHAKNGFTSAQGFLNAVETAMYFYYLWTFYSKSVPATAAGAETRAIRGRAGACAVLVGFSAAVMTLSKTVLYWANEYYSGFDNIGHNAPLNLLFLWIIPNGAWLVGATYMSWSLGGEIITGLESSTSHAKKE